MKKFPVLAIVLSLSINANAENTTAITSKIEQLKQLLNEIPQELSTQNNTQVLIGNDGNKQFQQNEQLIQTAKALIIILDNANQSSSAKGVTGLEWQKADISTVSTNTLYNAGNTTNTINICRASFIGNHAYGTAVYPGMLTSQGCYISYAGYAFSFSNFQVLTGNNANVKWIPYNVVVKNLEEANATVNTPKSTQINVKKSGDLINFPSYKPQKTYADVMINNARPVAGGYDNGLSVLICRATYQNKLYAGKLVNDSCNISSGDKEVVVANDFEMMFI